MSYLGKIKTNEMLKQSGGRRVSRMSSSCEDRGSVATFSINTEEEGDVYGTVFSSSDVFALTASTHRPPLLVSYRQREADEEGRGRSQPRAERHYRKAG